MQDDKVYVPHSDTRDILAGALRGRLLSVVAPIVAGPLVIYPANVSIVLLAVLGAIQRLQPKLDWPWRVIMGISLDGVVFLIIKDTYGYYSNPAIVGTLVLLLIYIALAPLREKATHVRRKGDQRHYFRVWTSLGPPHSSLSGCESPTLRSWIYRTPNVRSLLPVTRISLSRRSEGTGVFDNA